MQLKTKTFLTKTKKGNILKIVREHYLRDDLWCGSQCCRQCSQNVRQAMLDEHPISKSSLYSKPHYIVLDTNVILHQIDVLEEDVLCNVIILQTVLEEVKHRSTALYKRLNDIIANKRRKFYVFVNEHHQDTYIERLPGEKINDRNDRAIRAAASWYTNHLQNIKNMNNQFIILLSDDEENRRLAEKEGIAVCAFRKYVESLNDCIGLVDKLSSPEAKDDNSPKDALFPPHLTPTEIQSGIKGGLFKQGKYSASRENYREGNVMVAGYDKPILLQGRSGTNRAVDGDTVAIEIFAKELWCKPSGMVVLEGDDELTDKKEVGVAEAEIEQVEGEEGEIVGNVDTAEVIPTGRVVGIIRRKWRQYCGILQPSTLKGAVKHLFVPADKKIPRVRIETRQAVQLASQKILVALDSWPRHSCYPLGHFVRALGLIGDRDTENEVILLEHDVPHSKFSDAVLACLPQEGWTIPDDERARRVDLRDTCICSVDPPGCTDIDDALHCRPLSDGTFEVGVHIADVTYFVKPATALDAEAAKRSTTVYLVGRRVDMLPDMLSSNLCSLRGGEERLAFSCIWTMDSDANILSTRFHKSVIKSRAAMTYEEAQLTIDDSQRTDDVAIGLRGLLNLARILRQRRRSKGALILASPEIRFQIDSETNDPLEVEAKKHHDTNWMVEEFMLLANTSVAEKTVRDFPELAMLRRHEAPPQSNFEGLIRAAAQKGVLLDTTTSLSLARSLDEAPESINLLLRVLATRCMRQALYFTAGELKPDDYHHYGLACPIYTHFTSPIRRYADVVVHRLLATSLGIAIGLGGLVGLGGLRVASNLASHINIRHRAAQYASRASVALATHTLFRKIPQGSKEAAVVLGVRKNALQILVPRLGLEGLLMLPTKTFIYNPEEQSQCFGNILFRIFDNVTVKLRLDSSKAQHQRLVFELLEPYVEGLSPEVNVDELKPAYIGSNEPVEMDVDLKETAECHKRVKDSSKKSKKKKKIEGTK